MNRSADCDVLQLSDALLHFFLRNIGSGFHGNDGKRAAGYTDGAGDDPGRVGALFSAIGFSAGAGVSGNADDLALIQCDGEGTSQRTVDADQFTFFHKGTSIPVYFKIMNEATVMPPKQSRFRLHLFQVNQSRPELQWKWRR